MGRRRKKPEDSASSWLGLVLLACIGAGGTILSAIAFFLQAFVTFGLYVVFPLLIAFGTFLLRSVPDQPPLPPDARSYDPVDATAAVAELQAIRSWAEIKHSQVYEVGRANDIALTKSSGEKLFDTRPKLGRQLNAKLEELETQYNEANEQIRAWMTDVYTAFPDWQSQGDMWIKKNAGKNAFKVSVMIMPVVFLALLLMTLANVFRLDWLANSLLWSPVPEFLMGPLLVAVSITIAAACTLYFRALRDDEILWTSPEYQAWLRLEEKWGRGIYNLDLFPQRRIEDEDHASSNEGDSENEKWFSVLAVAPDSPFDQIRTAYLKAVKDYHPDRVAGLGDKLRQLAEDELKRINAAYEEAEAIHKR